MVCFSHHPWHWGNEQKEENSNKSIFSFCFADFLSPCPFFCYCYYLFCCDILTISLFFSTIPIVVLSTWYMSTLSINIRFYLSKLSLSFCIFRQKKNKKKRGRLSDDHHSTVYSPSSRPPKTYTPDSRFFLSLSLSHTHRNIVQKLSESDHKLNWHF